MPNNIVEILYTDSNIKLSNKVWDYYFNKMPEAVKGEIIKYKRWQDRQLRLLGKLLLLGCLEKYGYPPDCLNNILFEQCGRPYIDNNTDFSISHSGEYVICSITCAGRVGIDIEKISPINLSDFEQFMTFEQCMEIKESDKPYDKFYDFWTINESVLKADGRGLSIPLLEINTDRIKVILSDTVWFLRKIDIDSGYSCHLAMDIEHSETWVNKINFLP